MNIIQKTLASIDGYQRRRKRLSFAVAVVKKYGDDQAGYQAALVTYYGFLSLFPLLLILTTVAGILSSRDPQLGNELIGSVSSYFPVIGESLESSVRTGGKSGLALVIGLLLSLYGARGIADAFRNAINNIWHIPLARRSGFPQSLLRNIGIIVGGGVGFVLASSVSGWAATAVGRGPIFTVLSIIVNWLILYGVFLFIFRLSLPLSIAVKQFQVSAVIAATGLAILQRVGAEILNNITPSAYSALFATTLGLLAWIYLQAQVVMYATVVATVHDEKLWPRGLTDDKPTAADKKMAKRRER